MVRQRIADILVRDHQLDSEHVYLLNLIPVIELMWADDRLQPAEISLLYEYTTEWLALLSRDNGGCDVVSTAQANVFIERFISQRPCPELLGHLKDLAHQFINAAPETMRHNGRDEQLLTFCMDIAAAAVTQYPYNRRCRITPEEKALLLDLIEKLQQPQSIAG